MEPSVQVIRLSHSIVVYLVYLKKKSALWRIPFHQHLASHLQLWQALDRYHTSPGKSLAWNPVKGLVNVWSRFTWQDEDGETPATLEVFWAEARHFYGFQRTKSFTQRKWAHWQHNLCIGFKDMVEWSSFLKTCQQGIGQSPVPAVAVQRSSWRQDIEMQLMVPWDRFWIDVFLVCFLVCPLHFFRFHNFFQDSARWVKSFMKLCHWNQPFDRLHISHLQALSTITMVYILHIT